MTLPDEKKQPLLRQFHKLCVKPGWTFDECGPNEKDRQLLVEWTVVSDELNRLDARYVAPPTALLLSLTRVPCPPDIATSS